MRRYLFLSLFCLTVAISLNAQVPDTVRVCTYNLLQFGADDTNRVDEFRLVLNEIQPHILVVQEVMTDEGLNLLRDSVAALLNRPLASISFGNPHSESFVAVFYDSTSLVVTAERYLTGSVRLQPTGLFRLKNRSIQFAFVAGHWREGDSEQDATLRYRDGNRAFLGQQEWRESVPDSNRTLLTFFAGDMNVYSSEEPGYKAILGDSTSQGVRIGLEDPIGRPGDWHNNQEFTSVHTRSTRTRPFGGGVARGLDDRFDQILVSPELLAMVLPGSYTTFGNDGQHFNDSINAQPNTAVSAEMAQALHDASDHLPVYVDFVFGATSDVEEATLPDMLELTVIPSLALPEE